MPGIQKGNARFDEKKLAHINTEQLRRLSLDKFQSMAAPVLKEAGIQTDNPDYLRSTLSLCQPKTRSMEELHEFVAYFFNENFEFDEKTGQRLFAKGEPLARLDEVKSALTKDETWTDDSLNDTFNDLAVSHGQEKPFAWFPITRFSVSGTGGGPDLIPMLVVLGKDRVLSRMDAFPERFSV